MYVLVAVLGVAAPLVVTLAMGEKAQQILDSWKAWLRRNNAVVMGVLFLIFAVVLIGKGIAGIVNEHREAPVANLVGLKKGGHGPRDEAVSSAHLFHVHQPDTGKVMDAMAEVLRGRGCDVQLAAIDFTDPR